MISFAFRLFYLLCRLAATKYNRSAAIIHAYFYSNTVSLAMANGQRRNRSMYAIPCTISHLHQMLDARITFWLLHQRIYTFIALHRQSMCQRMCFSMARFGLLKFPHFALFFISPVCSETTAGQSRLDIQIMSRFSDHSCTVWRVSWNLTGTILSSSGDDGCVRMWKSKSFSVHSSPIQRNPNFIS